MKERPILFSGAMVRPILAGAKTQTRRIVKFRAHPDGLPMRPDEAWTDPSYLKPSLGGAPCLKMPFGDGDDRIVERHFPRWSPGERLWVRETWGIYDQAGFAYDYPSGIPKSCPRGYHASYPADDDSGIIGDVFKWRPSIHMPRWASRINLEVESIRVERLQDISEADAIAEGVELAPGADPAEMLRFKSYLSDSPLRLLTAYESYASLWVSINGPGSWEANPYVWVVTFRRL